MIRYEVNMYGPRGAGFELDRLADGPGPGIIMAMEGALASGTLATEARAHVITGGLKASIHPESNFTGGEWEGTIKAARYPGIFELARDDMPTRHHPLGGHYFFDPGGPDFLRNVRQAVWDWVTGGDGGPAPPGNLGPYSGG